MSKNIARIDEIGHAWYHQHYPSGKCSAMFYHGDSIYSYGHHWEIARKYNYHLVLFRNERYGSGSTGRHMNIVKDAIPHGKMVLLVYEFFSEKDTNAVKKAAHLKNIDGYTSQVFELMKKLNPKHKTPKVLSDIESARDNAQAYIKEFKVPASYLTKWQKDLLDNNTRDEDAKIISKWRKAKAKADKELAEKQEAENKKKIAAWRRGSKKDFPSMQKTFLRVNIKRDGIETSKGSMLPFKEAKLLHRALLGQISVIGMKLNGYEVKAWSEGILTIGCHHIEKSELNYICKKMQWAQIT